MGQREYNICWPASLEGACCSINTSNPLKEIKFYILDTNRFNRKMSLFAKNDYIYTYV